jgi:hypothetical protein
MGKRTLAAVAAVALGAAALTVSGSPAFAATKVDAHGTLHCAMTGKVKVSPPLVFGGTAAGGATFSAKISTSSCSGTSGVTSVKGTFTAHLPSNDCTALALIPFPGGTFGGAKPLKFKGGAKYNPSSINFTAGGTFTAATPIVMHVPGAGSSSIPSGSFQGQHATLTMSYDQSAETFATNCAPKTKGLKGSGGLKKMSFGGASAIDITS